MNALITTSVTVSLVMACALGMAATLRSRSAAVRHWVLAAAIASALAAPLLQTVAPSWSLPRTSPAGVTELTTFDAVEADVETTAAARPNAVAFPFTPAQILVPLWLAGAGISLSILLIAMIRLTRIASRATRIRDERWMHLADAAARQQRLRRPVVLLHSDHPTLLVTWGLVHPKIILPAVAGEWSDDRIHVVLAHELAHIGRWDWAVQLMAELLRSIYWFNPLVWIACGRMRRESEQACDDEVLNLGVAGPDYASHLLELARALRNPKPMWSPAPAMARPSTLQRRIRAMLNGNHNRLGITRSMRIATSFATLALTVVIAGFAAAQTFSTVAGSIVDPQGASLADARVVLSNVQTRAKHEVRSTPAGQFEFLGITPGDYLLEAVVPGFKSLQEKVAVVGGPVRQDLSMQVGTLEETVAVTPGLGKARSAEEVRRDERLGQQAQSAYQAALQRCRDAAPVSAGAVGGKIRPPRKTRDVRPLYPEVAQAQGIAGTVKLVATIGTDGLVNDVRSVDSAVNADLVTAATDAVKQWEFDPTLLNCTPVEVEMTVSVGFSPER